jgi:hypothetical protein
MQKKEMKRKQNRMKFAIRGSQNLQLRIVLNFYLVDYKMKQNMRIYLRLAGSFIFLFF